MTKQTATSPEGGGASGACSKEEPALGGFELLIRELKTQTVEFKVEDTVLIGNCPQNVTEEEINKFFCGFATIVKLQQVTHKLLTTNVFVAKFDSAESASRSKVLNTLSLNGKKILLLQPDEQHFVDRKNVVELNGLQEHTEEVIYDHMTTFGNVSFVLKTNTVTYVVFEERSAVEASCRCDYLDQYPVTIRSVLDGSAGAASIETCILDQIDQNSSLLVEEEEGQINNFIQLLDMENLDDYLEVDEKDKSTGSDKPLLEVGNEEIIVTEDETGADGEEEADVAAIEKQALQSQKKKSVDAVLVDDRTKRILKLEGNTLRLDDLPQLQVAVQKISKPHKVGPKKTGLTKPSGNHGPSKISKEKHGKPNPGDKKASGPQKKAADPVSSEAKKKNRDEGERGDKSKGDKQQVVDKAVTNSTAKINEDKPKEKHVKKQKDKQVSTNKAAEEGKSEPKNVHTPEAVSAKQEQTRGKIRESTESMEQLHKKKKEVKVENENAQSAKSETTPVASEKPSAQKKNASDHKKERQPFSKQAFVQLTKLSPKQIESLSTIRRTVTSQSKAEDDSVKVEQTSESTVPTKQKKPGPDKAAMKKPGPDKAAMKKHLASMKAVSTEKTTKKSAKRVLSDSEDERPSKSVDIEQAAAKIKTETDTPQKKKKPKLDKPVEKVTSVQPDAQPKVKKEVVASPVKSDDKTSEESRKDSEPKLAEDDLTITTNVPEQVQEESTAVPELLDKISESVPDIANTVEIGQVESAVAMDSDEEHALVIDLPQEQEKVIGKHSMEEKKPERICVTLDAKSAGLIKGKTHDENRLFLDVLPRLMVKLKQIAASDYIVSRPKEHVEHSTEQHAKPHPKKVTFDASSVKRKEEKHEKPRKINLDRIDSKFLPAGSKLKSKVKSKTDINHKKHLPVPDLPIELKTHLNTSFKIPKKNSNVAPASLGRAASELNCLHKEADNQDEQRKRYQKERKPRDNNNRKQKRSDAFGPPNEREPSPVDYFDPAHDDGSPSPQRIPPTPPQSDPATSATGPSKPGPRNENRRFEAQNRGNNKPSFQDIWNIPKKKPEVWAKPPWQNTAAPADTLNSDDTWDSEPVQQPLREQNLNSNQNRLADTKGGWSPGGPKPRTQQQKNTIDAGESWSPPGGGAQRKPPQTIQHDESWSPGPSNRNIAKEMPRDPPFGRSRSPRPVQVSNTLASADDMWDDAEPIPIPRQQPAPNRDNSQNRNQNPLLGDETWDDELADQQPTPYDRRPSIDQPPFNRPSPDRRRHNLSPIQQRRSRSRSPVRRRRSADRSPIRRNRGPSPDRRNFRRSRSREQSPMRRKRSRSRSPDQQRRLSLERWNLGASRSPDRRNFDRDRSPFGGRMRRSRSRSPPGRRRGSPFRGSPGPFRPRRSCSPPRAGLALASPNMWDSDRVPPRAQRASPRRDTTRHGLLSGETWDDDIVPLRGRSVGSPPRLRDALQDRRPRDQRFPFDRISPSPERRRSRSRERDRSLSGRRETSFDRPLLFEGSNRRWSRDRSPDRRKRSRSRSPGRWRRSMERSPPRRRPSFGERSPTYQKTLDYWKAVEDQEMGSTSPNRADAERNESPLRSPDRWSPREVLQPGDRSWSPPPPRVRDVERHTKSRIDSEELWANDPKPRYRRQAGSTYSPSSAFDAISSDEECDFTNPLLGGKKRLDTIPLKLPKLSQSPPIKLNDSSAAVGSAQDPDAGASRDSFDSIPSFKELDSTTLGNKEATPDKLPLEPTTESTSRSSVIADPVPENLSPQPLAAQDEKKSVLENLKQRAERLKKLEEMKLARQKLLAQIKQKNAGNVQKPTEAEPKHNETAVRAQQPDRSSDEKPKQPEAEPPNPIQTDLPPKALPSTVTNLLGNIPPIPQPELTPSPLPRPPMAFIPVCPPLPFGAAPPIPPLPAEAPPPPPPDDPPPPAPPPETIAKTNMPYPANAWERVPSFAAPMLPVDVSQPPPQVVNPLLLSAPPEREEDEQPSDDYSIMLNRLNASGSQMPPSSFMDRFQRPEPNRRQNFNAAPGSNQFNLVPPEEINLMKRGQYDFTERTSKQDRNRDPRPIPGPQFSIPFDDDDQPPEEDEFIPTGIYDFNQQQGGNRDPRQQNRPQHHQQMQMQQHRFGGNNQQQRDPRQNHAGNIYGGNRGRGGRFNRNQGNRFNNFNNNNNPGNNFNNFNNNNPGNNFNNNPGNNFNNNRGNNRFNNNRRNNFNNNFGNDPGNFNDNFNCEADNNFGDNTGNNFNNDNFGDGPGNNNNNFNDDFDNNADGDNFNNFNNSGNRFNDNQQQQRFNFQQQQQQRNQRFNNNRFNNNQQQHQQQFDEGCFDMNEMDGGGNYDGDANWDE